MSRRIIIGAGSLGREVYEWGCEGPSTSPPCIFIDDKIGRVKFSGHTATPLDAFNFEAEDVAHIAIADPNMRAQVWRRASQRIGIGNFRHRTAIQVNHASALRGLIMLPYSLISIDASLGCACVLNTHTTVGHDVRIGDFCTLSSHVDICGRVTIGDRVFFGSGARVLPDVTIGNDAIIGAGAVVVQDVPAGATVFGNPARRVK
jgi:sugar O-acyltransferase (sialic acid O-acetyltransferase NeuD family)